jgi:hypothetical protein
VLRFAVKSAAVIDPKRPVAVLSITRAENRFGDESLANEWKNRVEVVGTIAIVAGLLLVAYELRQNSDLMRAQISMDRASMAVDSLTTIANDGEISRIQTKLEQEVDGFPFARGIANALTAEESVRFRLWMIARSNEFSNDWYQCSKGFVEEESCQREIMGRVVINMIRFYEFGLDYKRWPLDAVQELQPYTEQYGLPALNDDGTWSE